MKIAIAGATGLVGSLVFKELLKHSDRSLITFTRQPIESTALHQNIIIDWENWVPTALDADVFICCLGTTMKSAGSKENFKKVDFQYVKKFAEAARLSHAKKFIFVSANGANPKSSVFYNKIKGETEDMLKGFNFQGLALLRPSLLIGKRAEKRLAEKIAQKIFPTLDFLLLGPLEKYQSISAQIVADDIVWLALNEWSGEHILESDELKRKSFKFNF